MLLFVTVAIFLQFIVLSTYSNYWCHLNRFLNHAEWNIFFTFLNDEADQRKLETKRVTVV